MWRRPLCINIKSTDPAIVRVKFRIEVASSNILKSCFTEYLRQRIEIIQVLVFTALMEKVIDAVHWRIASWNVHQSQLLRYEVAFYVGAKNQLRVRYSDAKHPSGSQNPVRFPEELHCFFWVLQMLEKVLTVDDAS